MKKSEILDNIKSRLGITELNEMQRVMTETEKRDIILLAPTGSGKTLAFAIRMLRNIDAGVDGISAVVLAPSRELVIQLSEVIRPLATGLKTVAFYGGHSMTDEINSLSVTPNIIISTPGRLVDHLSRNTLSLANVKSLILDEYDKSLELGFLDEMRRIAKRIRRPSLKMLISATRLDDIPEFIGNFKDFIIFNFTGDVVEPTLSTTILTVQSPDRDKLPTLVQLLRSLDNGKVIIFVNHRESAERVYNRLRDEGFPVGLYHGGLEQQQRRQAIDLLENGTTPILVSTDLASRGLDIPEVSAVVHYHLPLQAETWTHRNGRTARQGATGSVFAILNPDETLPFDDEAIDYEDFTPSSDPIKTTTATLYINAGKREKISKGDIVGFLIQKGGLTADQIGTIKLSDHSALVAVPSDTLPTLLPRLASERLKARRVRITPLRP